MFEILTRFGIHPASRVSLLGVRDSDFLRAVLPYVANPSQHRAAPDSDLIFLAVESSMQLKRLAPLVKYLRPGGALWIVYPDSFEHGKLLPAVLAAGLAPGEVLAFGAGHSALHTTPA